MPSPEQSLGGLAVHLGKQMALNWVQLCNVFERFGNLRLCFSPVNTLGYWCRSRECLVWPNMMHMMQVATCAKDQILQAVTWCHGHGLSGRTNRVARGL